MLLTGNAAGGEFSSGFFLACCATELRRWNIRASRSRTRCTAPGLARIFRLALRPLATAKTGLLRNPIAALESFGESLPYRFVLFAISPKDSALLSGCSRRSKTSMVVALYLCGETETGKNGRK